ncbi:MAG: CmcJ/NvfI family oxidoreductase [Gammaproteobacteria bacterium]|nr:CmcJ/NvfI family oxidoreductase [Gammaproteobacteria bacterium]
MPLIGHRARVLDRHASTGRPTLAIEDFELLSWPTRVTDVVTPAGRRAHARETEALIIKHTAALVARTLGRGVVRRSEHAPRHLLDGTTVPARFVHCDFAAGMDPDWVRQQLPPDQAPSYPTERIAIFNVWRSLPPPPQDTLLALCDSRSLDASGPRGHRSGH